MAIEDARISVRTVPEPNEDEGNIRLWELWKVVADERLEALQEALSDDGIAQEERTEAGKLVKALKASLVGYANITSVGSSRDRAAAIGRPPSSSPSKRQRLDTTAMNSNVSDVISDLPPPVSLPLARKSVDDDGEEDISARSLPARKATIFNPACDACRKLGYTSCRRALNQRYRRCVRCVTGVTKCSFQELQKELRKQTGASGASVAKSKKRKLSELQASSSSEDEVVNLSRGRRRNRVKDDWKELGIKLREAQALFDKLTDMVDMA